MVIVICEQCGSEFNVKPSALCRRRGRWCSMVCRRTGQRAETTLFERFEAKFSRGASSDCWLWDGATDGRYGRIQINGETAYAHRVAYEFANGPIPDGLNVLHHCDTPPCVNPFHLFLGNTADNSADMVLKGRQARGEENAAAKLTEADVVAIRRTYKSGSALQREIAEYYGVARSLIGRICFRTLWKHIADVPEQVT